MYLQTASLLRRRYGLYSERLLQQDEDNIADLYKANGFPDVMVMHPPVQDNYGGDMAIWRWRFRSTRARSGW